MAARERFAGARRQGQPGAQMERAEGTAVSTVTATDEMMEISSATALAPAARSPLRWEHVLSLLLEHELEHLTRYLGFVSVFVSVFNRSPGPPPPPPGERHLRVPSHRDPLWPREGSCARLRCLIRLSSLPLPAPFSHLSIKKSACLRTISKRGLGGLGRVRGAAGGVGCPGGGGGRGESTRRRTVLLARAPARCGRAARAVAARARHQGKTHRGVGALSIFLRPLWARRAADRAPRGC